MSKVCLCTQALHTGVGICHDHQITTTVSCLEMHRRHGTWGVTLQTHEANQVNKQLIRPQHTHTNRGGETERGRESKTRLGGNPSAFKGDHPYYRQGVMCAHIHPHKKCSMVILFLVKSEYGKEELQRGHTTGGGCQVGKVHELRKIHRVSTQMPISCRKPPHGLIVTCC